MSSGVQTSLSTTLDTGSNNPKKIFKNIKPTLKRNDSLKPIDEAFSNKKV